MLVLFVDYIFKSLIFGNCIQQSINLIYFLQQLNIVWHSINIILATNLDDLKLSSFYYSHNLAFAQTELKCLDIL
jgi:hypothetical protein